MRLSIILFLIFISVADCFCQNRGNIWCFGHYAAINFNGSVPVPDTSAAISRGSCASICDTSGNLQFYVAGDTVALYAATLRGGKIYNKLHQLMQGGDSIVTRAWYNEEVIIPFPNDTNQFYVFTAGVTSIYGLYYSVVDLNLNGGLGAVVQKNIELQNFPLDDCLTAVKHGNGRDWWLLFRKTDGFSGSSNNEFYSYLINPAGISSVNVQSVGTNNSGNTGDIIFNKEGDRFIYSNMAGMFEIYFFDRCTGIITLDVTVQAEPTSNFSYSFDGELSADGNVFYISSPRYSTYYSYLIQYDLNAGNILASADTLWTQSYPVNAAGQLKRGPDDKIYFTCAYVPLTAPMYPYADSLYNMYNMNISVINSPDSLGTTCDFQPYSFYLGGKRTYWGLPNNPDYDMPPLYGSVCDSLSVCNAPTEGLKSVNITSTTAQLKWKKYPNATGYRIRYKQPGLSWKYKTVFKNVGSKVISNLIPGKKYRWGVATICAPGDTSVYSVTKFFTTAGAPHNIYNVIPDTITELIYPYPGKEVLYESPSNHKEGELSITYVGSWEKAFINAQYLEGTTYTLTVTDIMGRLVFKESGKLQPPYFTKDLNCAAFAKGMYIVTLTTNREQVTQKFIKE